MMIADGYWKIVEPIAELTKMSRGYCKEVNKVSISGADPYIDIRKWHISEDGRRTMCRGVSLTDEAAKKLAIELCKYFGLTVTADEPKKQDPSPRQSELEKWRDELSADLDKMYEDG